MSVKKSSLQQPHGRIFFRILTCMKLLKVVLRDNDIAVGEDGCSKLLPVLRSLQEKKKPGKKKRVASKQASKVSRE